MNKSLSICIPTFNRYKQLLKQITFLVNEFHDWIESGEVEIIVRDNCSTDDSSRGFSKLSDKFKRISFYQNKENIGIINNFKFLENDASGKYIWLVGDDDKLLPGLGHVIMDNLTGEGLVFLNHNAVNKDKEVVMERAFDSKIHNNLYDIFDYSKTTMMFITACIYRKELLHYVFSTNKTRLTLPLYASFYCAEIGGMKLINDIYIENYWGGSSWSDKASLVFGFQVPSELFRSLTFSKNKKKLIKSLVKYCLTHKRAILGYWLKHRWLIKN